jgi:hypothetical protein
MVAIQAPGEAVWLPEGEVPHDEANMGSRRVPERHRGAGLGFHLTTRRYSKWYIVIQIHRFILGFFCQSWANFQIKTFIIPGNPFHTLFL